MLDYKILELDYGVSYGSVTLKSLQNGLCAGIRSSCKRSDSE